MYEERERERGREEAISYFIIYKCSIVDSLRFQPTVLYAASPNVFCNGSLCAAKDGDASKSYFHHAETSPFISIVPETLPKRLRSYKFEDERLLCDSYPFGEAADGPLDFRVNFTEKSLLEKEEKRLLCNASGKPCDCECSMERANRAYQCDVCNKSLKSMKSLSNHQATHSSERPFNCTDCSKRFKSEKHLRDHRTTHSNERPFVCEFCKKNFKSKRGLRKHELIHKRNPSTYEP